MAGSWSNATRTPRIRLTSTARAWSLCSPGSETLTDRGPGRGHSRLVQPGVTRRDGSPALILADEPVSSLDPKLSRVVLDILKRVCREDGITALVSLHTLELTREYADRVIGLKQGRIVFDGPTPELTAAAVDAIYHRQE